MWNSWLVSRHSGIAIAIAAVTLMGCQPNPDSFSKFSVRSELPIAVHVRIYSPFSDDQNPFIVNGRILRGEKKPLSDGSLFPKGQCNAVKSIEVTDAVTGKPVPVDVPAEFCDRKPIVLRPPTAT